MADLTIEERLEAIERQHAVLPDLQAAMKELKETAIVTAHMQARQGGLQKSQAEWLEELTLSQARTDEQFRETDKQLRETDKRLRETDERIDKLVSAIGELLRKNGK